MKEIGAVMMAFSLLTMGFLRVVHCLGRTKKLKQLEALLSLWQNEISFQAVSLPKLVLRYRKKMEWLESCAQKTEEGKDFLTAFWESVGSSSLGKEEKEALRVLGEGFGIGDLEAQISDLALCRARVAVILKKAEEEKEQQQKVAPMLGMAAGAAILLICL